MGIHQYSAFSSQYLLLAILIQTQVANHPLYPYPLKVESKFSAQPFPAQRAYTLEEGNIFWGRDYEISHFLEVLFSKEAPDFFLLYGASGVGKISLIQAGVLTRISKAQLLLNSVGEEASLVEALKKVTLKFDKNESTYQFILIEATQQSSLEVGALLKQLVIASEHRQNVF